MVEHEMNDNRVRHRPRLWRYPSLLPVFLSQTLTLVLILVLVYSLHIPRQVSRFVKMETSKLSVWSPPEDGGG